MKINIESVGMTPSENLQALIHKKVGKLEKFFPRIITADVTLKATQDSRKTSEAEVRLNVPNDTLFAGSRADSYEKALTDSVDALERQIKKYKEKLSVY